MKPEQMVALRLANWLKKEQSEILYRFDLAADLKLTIGQAKRNKQLNRFSKYPDLFIAETTKSFSGLYIELKATREDLYKKDGSFKKSEHIQGQRIMLEVLKARGYKAVFACGLEEAKKEILNYMKEMK
jgi:hypothetical protein